eukprot:9559400-Lingulodinium_polyedra.AAC.1
MHTPTPMPVHVQAHTTAMPSAGADADLGVLRAVHPVLARGSSRPHGRQLLQRRRAPGAPQ